MTAPKSRSDSLTEMPNSALVLTADHARAARMRPLEGTQPTFEAVATHQMLLDEGHPRTETCGDGGRDETGRAGSHDDEVVAVGRVWVLPPRRMHVGDELLIEDVVGLDERDWWAGEGVRHRLGHYRSDDMWPLNDPDVL